jgi:hypothetical protein
MGYSASQIARRKFDSVMPVTALRAKYDIARQNLWISCPAREDSYQTSHSNEKALWYRRLVRFEPIDVRDRFQLPLENRITVRTVFSWRLMDCTCTSMR